MEVASKGDNTRSGRQKWNSVSCWFSSQREREGELQWNNTHGSPVSESGRRIKRENVRLSTPLPLAPLASRHRREASALHPSLVCEAKSLFAQTFPLLFFSSHSSSGAVSSTLAALSHVFSDSGYLTHLAKYFFDRPFPFSSTMAWTTYSS